MRVLIGCECSGVVRKAFRALGHEAWSCDLQPSDGPSPFHHQGDLLPFLRESGPWDIGIFHPPCTYLTNSAVWALKDADFERYPGVGYHQKVKPETLTGAARRQARKDAVEFTLQLWNCGIPRIAIENPVGHLSSVLGRTPVIHPYQFGDDASKGTCLWLKGLPPLQPTSYFPPRLVEWQGKTVQRWSNQTDSGQSNVTPSDTRTKDRSQTYRGIAHAMASQWSRNAIS